jgi:hypothetical protein
MYTWASNIQASGVSQSLGKQPKVHSSLRVSLCKSKVSEFSIHLRACHHYTSRIDSTTYFNVYHLFIGIIQNLPQSVIVV